MSLHSALPVETMSLRLVSTRLQIASTFTTPPVVFWRTTRNAATPCRPESST